MALCTCTVHTLLAHVECGLAYVHSAYAVTLHRVWSCIRVWCVRCWLTSSGALLTLHGAYAVGSCLVWPCMLTIYTIQPIKKQKWRIRRRRYTSNFWLVKVQLSLSDVEPKSSTSHGRNVPAVSNHILSGLGYLTGVGAKRLCKCICQADYPQLFSYAGIAWQTSSDYLAGNPPYKAMNVLLYMVWISIWCEDV